MEEKIVYSQEQEARLQNEAIRFISQTKLILKGIVIIPKEIEVYYYKEGVFSDKSVHRNELQQNNKDHLYVHRNGKTKTDCYKGGNRAGVDFVVSSEKDVFYSYLIRSAYIKDKMVYGPHNVLETIKEYCNIDYNGIENNALEVEISDIFHDVILSKRINLNRGFIDSELRAIIFDKNFKESKYRDKERLITEKVKKDNMSKEEAMEFAKKILGYIPTSIRNL